MPAPGMHHKIQAAVITLIQFDEMVTTAKRTKATVRFLPVDMADTMKSLVRKFFRHVVRGFADSEAGRHILPNHPV